MKTELERLQDALKYQQRYLSFLSKIGLRVFLGVGTAAMVLILVAFHLSLPEGLSLAALILGGVSGWMLFVAIPPGCIWLCCALARWQIANYEKAIEKLEREE